MHNNGSILLLLYIKHCIVICDHLHLQEFISKVHDYKVDVTEYQNKCLAKTCFLPDGNLHRLCQFLKMKERSDPGNIPM